VTDAPNRIVSLSAESADWLWRIGAWDRVVGVTAFFEQPPEAPPKPRVSGFSTGRIDDIAALEPELVITFSDVQAQMAADLVKRGFPVLATNQRTLREIADTLSLLGRMVGLETAAKERLSEFYEQLAPIQLSRHRPRVYFEEWDDPLVSGICWVSELIERAGGVDIFSHLRNRRSAANRIISSGEVIDRDPEIILASWCGKPVNTRQIAERGGWNCIRAVQNNQIHEIPGANILQPGFRLVFGYKLLKRLIEEISDAGQ